MTDDELIKYLGIENEPKALKAIGLFTPERRAAMSNDNQLDPATVEACAKWHEHRAITAEHRVAAFHRFSARELRGLGKGAGAMSDGIRERGRYYDIIIEALVDYDGWMLDDDYEATPVLNRIMKRMRERLEMSDPPHTGSSAQAPSYPETWDARLANFAELKLLIDEYDPVNSDWNFRKGILLDILVRIWPQPLDHTQAPGRWTIQESVPSDGFECYYLLRDGDVVAEICGPQSDLRKRHLYDLVVAASQDPA